MGAVRLGIEGAADVTPAGRRPATFAPAGQSTQMIVGADAANDVEILSRAERLYGGYGLRRVYYSAFSPIPDSSAALPSQRPPLRREHRLYQADWLMRFYGFEGHEIVGAAAGGMLDLDLDPKLAWALANRERFPVDVNRAEREMLLRVPGLGVRTVERLLEVRRLKRIDLADLKELAGSIKRLQPFVVAQGWTPGPLLERSDLASRLAPAKAASPAQLSLF
jgi:predicted DNA-binding helix-hairpin-helix protein